jgi:hypothetical protein
MKQAITVTLDVDNLTWLKGRVGAARFRSVSDLLDRLVTQARTGGMAGAARSVVGTIDIDPTDPTLEAADAVVRQLFDASLARPRVLKERGPAYGAPAGRRKTRRG